MPVASGEEQGYLGGSAGVITTAALQLAFPAIVLSTPDRAFGYLTLFRSMVGVMTWLGLCAVLGVINGVTRGDWLRRRG